MKPWILGIPFLLFSCSPEPVTEPDTFQNWHKDPIRFMVENPYSEYLDSAIVRHTFRLDSLWNIEPPPPWRCSSNCLNIFTDTSSIVLVESTLSSIDRVRKSVYDFLLNPSDSSYYSDQLSVVSESGKTYDLTKGFIYLNFRPQISSFSKEVIREACLGIGDYKRQLAQETYDLNFEALDSIKKQKLNIKCSRMMLIDVFDFFPEPPLSPPPPPDTIELFGP